MAEKDDIKKHERMERRAKLLGEKPNINVGEEEMLKETGKFSIDKKSSPSPIRVQQNDSNSDYNDLKAASPV